MSYADFIWFLLSEEDKTTPTRYVAGFLQQVPELMSVTHLCGPPPTQRDATRDPALPHSAEYWFRCMDLGGDSALSPFVCPVCPT